MDARAKKAFNVLASKLKRLKQSGDIQKLTAFMASPAYYDQIPLLTSMQRDRIGLDVQAAFAAANKVVNLKPLPQWSKKGWRWWTAERIAKLKAVDARTGSDEAIARAFGISMQAAKRARYRYVGLRQPLLDRLAA